MNPRNVTLSITITFFLLAAPFAAEAQQTNFWAMEAGNLWDYVEGPSDTSPSRVQVTLDTGFSFPTYLMVTTENWIPVDNWRYDIHETGSNSSELRVYEFYFSDGGPQSEQVRASSLSGLIWAKRPLTVGDSWTSSATATISGNLGSGGGYITISGEVLAYESVDVPFGNGTYNAYKISNFLEVFTPLGLSWLTKTFWFVPYLGIIKDESVYSNDVTIKVYLSAMDIATVFTDALYDHWAYPYIMQIYDEGITLGYGDGRFGPDDPVTREQMAVFILKALNEVPADGYCGSTAPFSDVPVDRWSCKYVKRLVELGITSGIGGGLFGPEDTVTREQMAAFLTRALNEVPSDGYCGTEDPFTDVPYRGWSCKYVKRLMELGITSGIGDGLYGPGNPVTRAQMAVFLSRSFLGM
jgi:hypothetical protein